MIPIDSVTLSDRHGPEERTPTRRSARLASLIAAIHDARRSGHYVAREDVIYRSPA
jgi:hypothetical protein